MIIRGTVRECLAIHFHLNQHRTAHALLQGFAQVKLSSTYSWRVGSHMPNGISLLRVMVFLDLLGYSVTEFTHLTPEYQKLTRLIAYDILTDKQLEDIPGCKNPRHITTNIFRSGGKRRMQEGRLEKLRDICNSHDVSLQAAISTWQANLAGMRELQSPAADQAEVSDRPLTEAERTALVASFADFVLSADLVSNMDEAVYVLGQHFSPSTIGAARYFTNASLTAQQSGNNQS